MGRVWLKRLKADTRAQLHVRYSSYSSLSGLFQGEKAISVFDYASQFLKPWAVRWMQVAPWHFLVALVLVFGLFLRKVWFLHVLRERGSGKRGEIPFCWKRKPFSSFYEEVHCSCCKSCLEWWTLNKSGQ